MVHEYTKAKDRFPDWRDIIFGNQALQVRVN